MRDCASSCLVRKQLADLRETCFMHAELTQHLLSTGGQPQISASEYWYWNSLVHGETRNYEQIFSPVKGILAND